MNADDERSPEVPLMTGIEYFRSALIRTDDDADQGTLKQVIAR